MIGCFVNKINFNFSPTYNINGSNANVNYLLFNQNRLQNNSLMSLILLTRIEAIKPKTPQLRIFLALTADEIVLSGSIDLA